MPLCHILPAPAPRAAVVEHVSEEGDEPSALDKQTQTQTRTRTRSRNCHAQFISLLRRSLTRLYASTTSTCRCDGLVQEEVTANHAPFHDITGVHLGDKSESNQPRIFSYAELYIGTHAFSDDQILGSGGFGRVYKAVLPSDATLVAVKWLGGKGDEFEKTFAAELLAVAHLRHRNLVRLRGWCVHEDQLLLVYDYMPNLSLDRLLFSRTRKNTLHFQRRHKIVLGLAAALFYLHQQLETQIIHRDVKTSNVMLDSHFNARLGDFGLARWLEHEHGHGHEHDSSTTTTKSQSIRDYDQIQAFRLVDTTRIGGTIGYLPPESFQRRYTPTAKSDVFGFGIVALEVASGRRALDLTRPDDTIILLDWVRRLADDDDDEAKLLLAADPRLSHGSYQPHQMERLIHLGLLCTLHHPKSRPNMKWVLDALSGHILGKLPSLPSFKAHPLYISLSTTTTNSSDDTKSTTITITSSPTSPSSTIYITAAGQTIFLTAEDGADDNVATETESKRLPLNPFPFPVVETPREISYTEIVAATDNFSDQHRVAELDFGTAYHGFLDDQQHVLVKRLGMKTCPALRARFSTELHNLGRLRHRNLVQLRGWCTEQGEMLVVYDFLASRLLSNMLFHNSRSKGHPVLEWRHRYNIISSLASALLYLHEEWDEQVIHRNITSSSVVVDLDMNPRLSSFALAEFLTRNEHGHHVANNSSNSVRGIFGYMSPEYIESGEANTAADIYSFGVVMMEVISGQMAVDFRHPHPQVLLVKRVRDFEATNRPLEELVDPELDGKYNHEELVRLVKLGLTCTLSNPHLRPSMRQIASVLDGNSSGFLGGCKEGIEEWRQRNTDSLSLIRRIQALGIQ